MSHPSPAMRIITGIVPSIRPEGRYVVQVDGKPFATVPLDAVDRLRLRVGAPLEPVQGALEHEAALLRTYDRALNMLAFRARAARELRRQLVRKGEPADLVDAVIERLLRSGLLNDAEYARQVARSKALGQGFSRRRLQQELFRRGVDREVADEAITEVLADEAVDESALIEEVARKKLRTLAKLDPATRDRRLYAFLARRGYDSDAIRRAMKVVGAEEVEE